MNAQEFKTARIAKRLTQKELAANLGVSLSAVTKYEGGAKIPEWVAEKMAARRTKLEIKDLSAAEIVALEKKAASKGLSVDAIAAELIRSFLKLSLLAFALFHLSRTPSNWSSKALLATGKAAIHSIGRAALAVESVIFMQPLCPALTVCATMRTDAH